MSRREKLEAMLAEDPDDQMLRYMLAMELQSEDEFDRCLEMFDQLMNDQPPHVPSFLMAGQLLARLGRVDDATRIYETGIHQAVVQENDHAAGEMREFLAGLG